MEAIDEQGGKELETILQDAECHGVGNAVREIWEIDKQRMKEQFSQDQETNCEFNYYRSIVLSILLYIC